jgi:hypothetical protein
MYYHGKKDGKLKKMKEKLGMSLLFSGIMRNVTCVQDPTRNLHVIKVPV